MFDVSRLFIIFKISYLFSFFIITKGLQEERAGKYTLNVCFKLKQCTKGSDNFLYAPWQSTTDVKTIKTTTRFTQVSILLQVQAQFVNRYASSSFCLSHTTLQNS